MGKLCPFTRHPKTLARVVLLELRPAARFVLDVLLTFADREGWCWPKIREIQAAAPRSTRVKRYSEPTIKRSLRELKAGGFLNWERIPAFGHYPARPDRRGPAELGAGEFTMSGGRAWRVNFQAIADAADRRSATRGTPLAGRITSDHAGEITSDPPSDPFLAPLETVKPDPAPPVAVAPQPPAAARVASETPTRACGAGPQRASRAQVASETPPGGEAGGKAPASSPTPAPRRDEKRTGSEEHEPSQAASTPVRKYVVDEEVHERQRFGAGDALAAIAAALKGRES